MQALQREADQLAAQEKSVLGDLRTLEIERELRTEELQRADAGVAKTERDLSAASRRIDVLVRQDLAQRPDLRARLVEIYKVGQGRYLRMLLSAPDLRRIGEASRAVAALSKIDRDRVASHQRTLDDLKSTRRTLEERGAALQTQRAAAAHAQDAAVRAATARAALIRDIDRRRDLNAQLAGELQAAQQKLQLTLREVGAGGTTAPPSGAATSGAEPALPIRPFRGDLDWPVAGIVRRPFTRSGPTGFNGVEIASDEGTAVAAIHEGVVAFADTFAGFGNLVIVDHGSRTFSLYGNLDQLDVAKGARVDRGQRVGTVGSTPTGAAGLYFELRVDGQPVDPLQWLKRR
jgi:septal ring factor EnvC (AmiA/AmiB activator)